ncbi:MAG TPA: CHAT domain-containing protein [Desulfatiglandales bacterium]|nr:CHAT domain-containing protein [Desulfatiglandales bacterium]
MASFEHAIFGNRDGSHQLLKTSLVGEESILEELRFLVDRPVGHVGTEVIWSPYWGCGLLRNWWVLWRGEEDKDAPRKNMVKSYVSLIPQETVGSIENLKELFEFFPFDISEIREPPTGAVIHLLACGIRPVVVPDISLAPKLLLTLWPRLWPAARKNLSLRTVFNSEALEVGSFPDIVIIPKELIPRWRSHELLDSKYKQPDNDIVSYFSSGLAPELEQLLHNNWNRLPGDFTVLKRLERIASVFKILRKSQGRFADVLLVVRTLEAFKGGLDLQPEDLELLVDKISEMRDPTITDIRSASLAKLTIAAKAQPNVELTTAFWIQKNLQNKSDEDALWILEHQAGNGHVAWWLRAVRKGLSNAFNDMTPDWAKAIWRWWSSNIDAVNWTQSLISSDPGTEDSILKHIPSKLKPELKTRLIMLCADKQWARLLAGILRISEPLNEAVSVLREMVSEPELGLDVLIQNRNPEDIVAAAVDCGWVPLIHRAVSCTTRDIKLLSGVDVNASGTVTLLAAHINAGGILPSEIYDINFIFQLFDGCIDGEETCVEVVIHLGSRAAAAALGYSRQNDLWNALKPGHREFFLSVASTIWLDTFLSGEMISLPDSILKKKIRENARNVLAGCSIDKVIDFLTMIPEVSEKEAVDLLNSKGFSWEDGDDKKFGQLLVSRKWNSAAHSFRWSWKTELKAVAWHARELLSSWDRYFFSPPSGTDVQAATASNKIINRSDKVVKILFLAANPMNTTRLAIDEESRSIEEKLRLSRLRHAIVFHTRWATRSEDLQQALLEEEPTIVHFSGHGGGMLGIVLHTNSQGEEILVSSEALADLFKVLKENIRVVVLNACYSEEQAKAIVEEIDFVVGMSHSIGDEAARVFAAAFYRGLAFGKSMQTAFDLGLNELKLMNLKDDENIPVLHVRNNVNASAVTLVCESSS